MDDIQNRTLELEVLASTIRLKARVLFEQQSRLTEVLEAIERQDFSPAHIREQLKGVERGLTDMGRQRC